MYAALIDRHFQLSEPFIQASLQIVWIQISQFLLKLADQDLHCFLKMYAVLHNLVDMRATCFHMLKIASDGNFYLLFGENY